MEQLSFLGNARASTFRTRDASDIGEKAAIAGAAANMAATTKQQITIIFTTTHHFVPIAVKTGGPRYSETWNSYLNMAR